MLFRLFFAFDLLVAAVVLFFFFWGVSDGTVSSFNAGLWAALLAVLGGALAGGYYLNVKGHRALATLVLLIPALPGIVYVLFVLFIVIGNPRWN